MTAELTEARLQVMKSIHRHDPEVRVAIDMALSHVRARGQKPVAQVTNSSWSGMNVCVLADAPIVPVLTKLYAAPQPSYADGKRDGLLAGAKVCADRKTSGGAGYVLMEIERDIRALADKEPT